MRAANPASGAPSVSVIIPARNEQASLASCLESLAGQSGVTFEILVVDDGSTDRTADIARSFPGVRVLQPGPLRPGWSGKNNAVTTGADHAAGEWLLFTDADTVHAPGSLASALAEARSHKVDLLSYSPAQEVHGFWEKAVMPVIFAELAATFRPAAVSDPNSPAAAANGQYILISREAYDAVGGHAAVASSLLEDVALAQALKRSGRKLLFRFAGDAVRPRMYRSFAQLREGWTKNLALLFPAPGRLAALRLLEFFLIAGCAKLAVLSALFGREAAAGLFAVVGLALYGLFLLRIRRAHFSGSSNVLALIGLPIFSYLLLRSRRAHRHGSVAWKGRTYTGEAPPMGQHQARAQVI
jgi:hypothetical protein